MTTKRKTKTPTAQAKMNALGDEAFFAQLASGSTYTQIAKDVGVAIGSLITWVAADPDRSARAAEVRREMAKAWDEKAQHGLEAAQDPFELAKAKELAHHYRWRASKVAPKDYGDRQQVELSGGINLNTAIADLGDD